MSEEEGDTVRVEIRDLDRDVYDKMKELVDFFDDSRKHSKKHYTERVLIAGINALEGRRDEIRASRRKIERTNELMYDPYLVSSQIRKQIEEEADQEDQDTADQNT